MVGVDISAWSKWHEAWKGGKICGAARELFTLNETWARVCFSNIFLEQFPLNSSIMPWQWNKREAFPGKIRNNSVADNFSPWANQMKQFALTVVIQIKVTINLTEVLSLVIYWKCFDFPNEIISFLRSCSGLFFPHLIVPNSFRYTFKLSLFH